MQPLARIKRATARRSAAEQEWRTAVREGVASGLSLRVAAEAAGVSHVRVLQLTRE